MRMLAALFAGLAAAAAGAQVPVEMRDEIARRIRDAMAASSMSSGSMLPTKPGMALALTDRDGEVFSGGMRGDETVFRVASVSKLFTATAVMQLVEQGRLDLDVDIATYLPEWQPKGAKQAITLRHLLSHHAGILREPPVGHYFEAGDSIAAVAASMAKAPVVHPPETVLKYSNAGVAIAGHIVERVTGTGFVEHMQSAVLDPLGMSSSSFGSPANGRSVGGTMWTLDGRVFPAPTFALGMAPAANLQATMPDLLRFARSWFSVGDSTRLLSEASREAMFTRQFGSGVGIGFFLGEFDGALSVRHGGAIYGFVTTLQGLPEEGLAVAAAAPIDVASGPMRRVADYALRLALAAQRGRPLPSFRRDPKPTTKESGLSWEGRYGDSKRWTNLIAEEGRVVERRSHGFPVYYRQLGDRLVSCGAFSGRVGQTTIRRTATGIERNGRAMPKIEAKPKPCPAELRPYLGEYGWDHNVLYVFEEMGQLCVLVEWFDQEPLAPIATDRFAFPSRGGLYHGEELRFERDERDEIIGLTIGNEVGVFIPRRAAELEHGATFRIKPLYPIERLRQMAREARMPKPKAADMLEPDLVELAKAVDGMKFDLRYGTTNNFMGTRFYERPVAYMQRPAAAALADVQAELASLGYGFLVHDAYRPWRVTKMFWDATPESMKDFVANPANGSRHNRGCAVDLTLISLATGEPIEMVSGYDEFTPRAYPNYPGGTDAARWHRRLLLRAMERHGFSVYEWEWWHFDYRTWRRYPVMNRPLK